MLREDDIGPEARESANGSSSEDQVVIKNIGTDLTDLPYAPSSRQVAALLCRHIAKIRRVSEDSVISAYRELDAGFHLVFNRELCLKGDDLADDDHRGKRPLRFKSLEQLVEAVVSCEESFKVLARLLEKGRISVIQAANRAAKNQHARKALIIDVSKLIAKAKESFKQDIGLAYSFDCEMVASWKPNLNISFQSLVEISSLEDLYLHRNLALKHPIQNCAFVGGGGGSDVIQAAALAKLFTKANPILKVLAVISIRTLYSKSTLAGDKRSVWHVDDQTQPRHNLLDSSNGDLRIEPCHRGNARFVEDAIAADFDNTRLVIDDKSQDAIRCARYAGAIGRKADTVIVVDTGGDVLGGMDSFAMKKIPNQDRRTQLATAQIAASENLNALVAIAAIGVDAPPDAQRKLEASDAVYYRFTEADKRYLTASYSRWCFDGSPESLKKFPEHYGKTPFAMLASFELKPGDSGYRALPIPESAIQDFTNPWACITWITAGMSCLVLVSQAKLLSVIADEGKT